MSGPFDPDAYLAKAKQAPRKETQGFDPDAYLEKVKQRAAPIAESGSPLEKALAEQSGDVVTVQTPTGPAQFTRSGARFYGPEEAAQLQEVGGAKLKERALATVANTLGRGGLFGPQQAGLAAVTRPWLDGPNGTRPDEGVLEHYRRVRDATSRDLSNASRTADIRPQIMGRKVDILPALASAAPSLMAGGPAGIGGRLLLSTVLGAENAASSSDADLTRGEVLPFLGDTAKGGGFGLVTGGVAEGVTAPMRLIARGAASRIGDSVATQAAKDTEAVAEELAKLKGQLGGESQKMSRMFENTQRAAGGGVAPAGQSPIDPSLQGKALLALSDPSTVRLQEKVLNRTLGEMPGQTAVVERLESELAQKTANASAEAAKRTQDYFAKPVFQTEIAPRLGRLAYNAGTGAATGSAAGAAMGLGSMFTGVGDPLTAAAVGLGTGITQGLGKSAITMSRNAMAQPRLQVGALESLIRAAQAGQNVMRAEARSASSVESRLTADEQRAVHAFLSGG